MAAEALADHPDQLLGAIDDERARAVGIAPACDRVIDGHLHRGGVLAPPFQPLPRMLDPITVDADGGQLHPASSCLPVLRDVAMPATRQHHAKL